MKKMQIAGDEIREAAKIIKTNSAIIGYDINGSVLFNMSGINDWTSFVLLDGAEWDLPPEDEIQSLKARLETAERALLFLMDVNTTGGL